MFLVISVIFVLRWIVFLPLVQVGPTAGPVLLWVVGMSNIVHALVLSFTGIAVHVALARFHRLGRLTLDFTSFQLPGRSDCWATDGLLTSSCTPALVLLLVLTGRVSTSRTVDIIWTVQSLEPL